MARKCVTILSPPFGSLLRSFRGPTTERVWGMFTACFPFATEAHQTSTFAQLAAPREQQVQALVFVYDAALPQCWACVLLLTGRMRVLREGVAERCQCQYNVTCVDSSRTASAVKIVILARSTLLVALAHAVTAARWRMILWVDLSAKQDSEFPW